MDERVAEEVELVRSCWSDLEVRPDDGWALIPAYDLPPGVWGQEGPVEVAFQFPQRIGRGPYGFFVRPRLTLADGGSPQNYAYPAETPFGSDFGKFSWQLERWAPGSTPKSGTNMLDFVRSFYRRLGEGA